MPILGAGTLLSGSAHSGTVRGDMEHVMHLWRSQRSPPITDLGALAGIRAHIRTGNRQARNPCEPYFQRTPGRNPSCLLGCRKRAAKALSKVIDESPSGNVQGFLCSPERFGRGDALCRLGRLIPLSGRHGLPRPETQCSSTPREMT